MKSSDRIPIGQLAARFGLATHVLRHWESQGLLVVTERDGGRRVYDESHADRIGLILRGKELGLSLAEIRRFLDEPDHARHLAQLREHRDRVDEQIDRLEAIRRALGATIGDGA